MISSAIVSSYKQCIEIALWLSFLVSILVGWTIFTIFFGSFFSMLIALASWFVIAVGFFGALLVLEDIRERVKNIEASKLIDPAP